MVRSPTNGGGMFFLASLGPTTSSVFIRIVVVVATLSHMAERCSSSLPSPLASLSPLRARSFESCTSSLSVLIRLTPTLDLDASRHRLLVGADPDRVDDALAITAVADVPRAVRSPPARLHMSHVAQSHKSCACVVALLAFCALPSCVLNPQLEQRLGALPTSHSCAASVCTSFSCVRANATDLLIGRSASKLSVPCAAAAASLGAGAQLSCTWPIAFIPNVTELCVSILGAHDAAVAAANCGGVCVGSPARVLIALDARVKGRAGSISLARDHPTTRGYCASSSSPSILSVLFDGTLRERAGNGTKSPIRAGLMARLCRCHAGGPARSYLPPADFEQSMSQPGTQVLGSVRMYCVRVCMRVCSHARCMSDNAVGEALQTHGLTRSTIASVRRWRCVLVMSAAAYVSGSAPALLRCGGEMVAAALLATAGDMHCIAVLLLWLAVALRVLRFGTMVNGHGTAGMWLMWLILFCITAPADAVRDHEDTGRASWVLSTAVSALSTAVSAARGAAALGAIVIAATVRSDRSAADAPHASTASTDAELDARARARFQASRRPMARHATAVRTAERAAEDRAVTRIARAWRKRAYVLFTIVRIQRTWLDCLNAKRGARSLARIQERRAQQRIRNAHRAAVSVQRMTRAMQARALATRRRSAASCIQRVLRSHSTGAQLRPHTVGSQTSPSPLSPPPLRQSQTLWRAATVIARSWRWYTAWMLRRMQLPDSSYQMTFRRQAWSMATMANSITSPMYLTAVTAGLADRFTFLCRLPAEPSPEPPQPLTPSAQAPTRRQLSSAGWIALAFSSKLTRSVGQRTHASTVVARRWRRIAAARSPLPSAIMGSRRALSPVPFVLADDFGVVV